MIFPVFSKVTAAAGAAAGGVVVGLAVFAWMHVVTIPAAKQETRAVVEAEAERRTLDAIKAVSDAAERARAMRRYCAGRGLVYLFEADRCR
ncbi:MAG: hypothetical protein M9905_17605 [Rhizobiaceae bacterium]|nr:hypothetical protein [Rhizobiaceae bacterium]